MSFDAKALAIEQHRATGHPEGDWLKVLDSAQTSLKMIPAEFASLTHVARASRSPEKFAVMTRLIYQYGKAHPNGVGITKLLLDTVNSSHYSLADWIDAADYFHQWLVKGKRKIDLLPMVRYLECCAAAPDARKSGHTLVNLVEDMLATHGYEAG